MEQGGPAGVVDGVRVMASLGFGGGGRVGAEVARLHGGRGLPARVITWLAFTDPLEDVIQAQDVPHLVDHGVVVSDGAKIRRVQDHSTWEPDTNNANVSAGVQCFTIKLYAFLHSSNSSHWHRPYSAACKYVFSLCTKQTVEKKQSMYG